MVYIIYIPIIRLYYWRNHGYGLWCCTLNSTTASERTERVRYGIFPHTHTDVCGRDRCCVRALEHNLFFIAKVRSNLSSLYP